MRVTRDGYNFQAVTREGQVLFTFGRCRAPKRYQSGQQESASALEQKIWHQNGYWYVSVPGQMHETYIVTKEPVSKGFIEASWDDVVAMKTRPDTLLRGFSAIMFAVINWKDYDL